MARPLSTGLQYFPLDVDILADKKVEFVVGKYGAQGFGLFVYLLTEIYHNGYFLHWDEMQQFCSVRRINVDINILSEVVNAYINAGLFDADVYAKYQILTSRAIQKRYIKACERRNKVIIEEKYCLLTPDDVKEAGNKLEIKGENVSVGINTHSEGVNVDINTHSEGVNAEFKTQSKVKNSKVKDSKEKENKEKVFPVGNNPAVAFFQNNFHPFTGEYESQSFLDLIDDYGERWVMDAMKIAVRNNALNLKFVSKVLENWQKFGYGNKAPVTNWRDGHGSNTESDLYGNVFDERCAEPLGSRTN